MNLCRHKCQLAVGVYRFVLGTSFSLVKSRQRSNCRQYWQGCYGIFIASFLQFSDDIQLNVAALGEDSLYSAEQIRGREWLGDIGINTFIKASLLIFYACLGRENHHWDVAEGGILLDLVNHRQTIHHRHGNVCKDKVGRLLARHHQASLSVLCEQHVIGRREDTVEELAQVVIVFNYQYSLVFQFRFFLCFFLFLAHFFQAFCLCILFFFLFVGSFQIVRCIVVVNLAIRFFSFCQVVIFLGQTAVRMEVCLVAVSLNLVQHYQHLVSIVCYHSQQFLALSGDTRLGIQNGSYRGSDER